MDKKIEKQIQAQLKEYGKLKGAALRAKYEEVVGHDTKETNRERLLHGIARALYHKAEEAQRAVEWESDKERAKAAAKKDGKKGKRKSAATAAEGASSAASSGGDDAGDAAAGATGGDAAGGGDGPGAASDAVNGADNANAGASAGATAGDADGGKKRRVMRPTGERDPRLPPAGTVLEKTYKGVVHKVTLLQDNGCTHEGKQYKSLSGVAKAIAGCNHNGLLFFGLVKRESKAKAPETSASADATAEAAQAE